MLKLSNILLTYEKNPMLKRTGMITREIGPFVLKVEAEADGHRLDDLPDEVIWQAVKEICQKVDFVTMGKMMEDMMGVDCFESQGLYVLKSSDYSFGAMAILNKNKLEEIYKVIGDYYILPSSIYEVLIIPANLGLNIEDLNYMVMDVNNTVVLPEDRLGEQAIKFTDWIQYLQ